MPFSRVLQTKVSKHKHAEIIESRNIKHYRVVSYTVSLCASGFHIHTLASCILVTYASSTCLDVFLHPSSASLYASAAKPVDSAEKAHYCRYFNRLKVSENCVIYTVRQKTASFYFCHKFVKPSYILIIFYTHTP